MRHFFSFTAPILLCSLSLSAQELKLAAPVENNIQAAPVRPGARYALGSQGTNRPIYVQSSEKTIPHLALGGGWETEVVLINMTLSPVTFTQSFFDTGGNPMQVTFKTIPEGTLVTGSVIQGTLAAEASMNIKLYDTSGTVRTGWSWITYDTTSARLGGFAVFRQIIAGRPDFEAVVPLSAYDDFAFYLPFDNTNGFVTAMALMNPASNLSTTVSVYVITKGGGAAASYTVNVSPGQQQSFTLPTKFPATQNTVGTLYVEGTTDRLSALGFRFNPGGAFSTVPVMNWSGMFAN